jgi:2-hydroxymuconate-semialdehyde hydrolase
VKQANPEIGSTLNAAGILTNYHDHGKGSPVILIHGSGPGVSAWVNWRANLPTLAKEFRAIAPDMAGFGFTERTKGVTYNLDLWVRHILGLMDALEVKCADFIGNSFGGGIALAVATRHPDRVRRLVLMGSVGVSFPITPGLEAVWGYDPSLTAMRRLLDIFAYDRSLVTDELAELRYRASIQPGFHEAFSTMFPAPRQQWVEMLSIDQKQLSNLSHPTLILHGREDQVIPPENAIRLFSLIKPSQLHMFGECGHWTQIEHAEEFNSLVASFLS